MSTLLNIMFDAETNHVSFISQAAYDRAVNITMLLKGP